MISPGMRALLGFVRGLLLASSVPVLLSGCLVTSNPDFQGQDECVPFFLTHDADPSTAGTLRRPENVSDQVFRATVPMRSCALTKNYEARVFVDNVLRVFQTIPPTGTEQREVSISVDISREDPGCHLVEVYVSTKFAADFKTSDRPGDLATINWSFYNDDAATAAGCEAR